MYIHISVLLYYFIMSFPPDKTFLNDAMAKWNQTKQLVMNGIPTIQYYVKEIKYLEEEINYWTTEYQINPAEYKLTKINQLAGELETIRNTYERLKNENNNGR